MVVVSSGSKYWRFSHQTSHSVAYISFLNYQDLRSWHSLNTVLQLSNVRLPSVSDYPIDASTCSDGVLVPKRAISAFDGRPHCPFGQVPARLGTNLGTALGTGTIGGKSREPRATGAGTRLRVHRVPWDIKFQIFYGYENSPHKVMRPIQLPLIKYRTKDLLTQSHKAKMHTKAFLYDRMPRHAEKIWS